MSNIYEDFNKLHKLKKDVDTYRVLYDEMRENRTLLNSPVDDTERVDYCHSSIDNMDKWLKLIDKELDRYNKLLDALNGYYAMQNHVFKKIHSIGESNLLYEEILKQRFMNKQTQSEVADIIGYTLRHIQRLEAEAIKIYEKM